MKTVSMNSIHWDDIVFENRNKDYGAYVLRKVYVKHIVTALIITVLATGLVLGFPAIAALFRTPSQEKEPDLKTVKYIDLAQPPPIEKVVPPKTDAPPPVKTVVKYLPPEVTNKEVAEEEKMPTIDDIRKNETGAENIEGTGDVILDEPVDDVVPGDGFGNENQVFTFVEQKPGFEGGMDALAKYLQRHLRYPPRPQRNGTEGTVFVSFIVNKEGSINEVQVLKGIDPDCDKEAVRVIQKMPPWQPGRQNGKPVRVRFVLPIRFKLNM